MTEMKAQWAQQINEIRKITEEEIAKAKEETQFAQTIVEADTERNNALDRTIQALQLHVSQLTAQYESARDQLTHLSDIYPIVIAMQDKLTRLVDRETAAGNPLTPLVILVLENVDTSLKLLEFFLYLSVCLLPDFLS